MAPPTTTPTTISRTSRPAKTTETYAPPTRAAPPVPKLTPEEIAARRAAYEKYGRGARINVKSVKDKKLRGNLKKLEDKYKTAALQAQDAEVLLGEERGFVETEGMERAFKITQGELKGEVDIATAQKVGLDWAGGKGDVGGVDWIGLG